ncbi:TIGR03364 family FAD-dependent oxidoreductase [Arthrobacter sp. 35W]|uniref:TIGR03364 family FAD-dependent oxidoreductase n=1 Tax=Arthrobacter sp. 35W TaxID=1132441 RepID=UPI0004041CD7|nr:TIGR03364 family FAD-dependent oxidoreductase [Arthrobacter sp. 35W]
MTSTLPAADACDILIVGAGITGLAHAAEAVSRGLSVHIIDRDFHAAGASVRNFGHACVTAQSGELLELARTAREGWLRHSELAGFFSVESGGLAVARSGAELGVIEELAAARPGEVELVPAHDVHHRLGGSGDPAIVGGALLHSDVRVDPREAVGRLALWLAAQPNVTFSWRTSYRGSSDGVAQTSRGTIKAAHTLVCVGHDLDQVYPELAEEFEVKRCGLQMALVEAPGGRRISQAVLSGTSMLRYPAFAETAAAAALRTEMEERSPELLSIDANLMFTQRPDGSLIVGDSHITAATMDPFLDEATSDTLLRATATLLGTGPLAVRQRWQGIYATSARQSFLIESPSATVTTVTVTSGIGMTISFGLARRTFETLGSTRRLAASSAGGA